MFVKLPELEIAVVLMLPRLPPLEESVAKLPLVALTVVALTVFDEMVPVLLMPFVVVEPVTDSVPVVVLPLTVAELVVTVLRFAAPEVDSVPVFNAPVLVMPFVVVEPVTDSVPVVVLPLTVAELVVTVLRFAAPEVDSVPVFNAPVLVMPFVVVEPDTDSVPVEMLPVLLMPFVAVEPVTDRSSPMVTGPTVFAITPPLLPVPGPPTVSSTAFPPIVIDCAMAGAAITSAAKAVLPSKSERLNNICVLRTV